MQKSHTLTIAALFVAGPACAQGAPGDANFCRQYAETAAIAAEDAIALNPACLDYGSGVHGDRKMHVDWCSRTPSDKVEGAAVHIRRLASRCTQGALVTPAEYGGYDIVGSERFERPYGRARQWDVRAAFSGRTFMYCAAEAGGKDHPVRIGFDLAMPSEGGQWQLAVPIKSRKDWQGRLEIDGAEPAARAGADVNGNAVGGWSIAWLNMGHVDALRNGNAAVLGVGKADYDFSLEGIASAITKIEECRSRKGAGAGNPQQPAADAQQKPSQDSGIVEVSPRMFRRWETLQNEWSLSRFSRDKAGKQVVACDAVKLTGSEVGLRVSFDKATRTLVYGFMGAGTGVFSRPVKMKIWFDDEKAQGETVDAKNVKSLDDMDWLSASQSNDGPGIEDSLMNRKKVTFSYPFEGAARNQSFVLAGSNVALKKLFACVDN